VKMASVVRVRVPASGSVRAVGREYVSLCLPGCFGERDWKF
jgi:hypothetical protein